MALPVLATLIGLILLVWSADRFVDGAAATARHLGVPPLFIGMVVIGFGTSAPEMVISAFSAMQGSPAIALGNAYGSNIANIALILGITALIAPIAIHPRILRRELPILTLITLIAAGQAWDGVLSRLDAIILLLVFLFLMGWSIYQGKKESVDIPTVDSGKADSPWGPLCRLIIGLLVMLASSRLLVWGAVGIAHQMGVSDLIVGLTVVAVGTSLPELASSIIAVRKGEPDLALGNILGSNQFNTLVVVGIAGTIQPMAVPSEVLTRDMAIMGILTLSLFVFGYAFRKKRPGRINRLEGGILLATYIGYTILLIRSVVSG